jgi:hypothetical protein
MAVLRTRRDAQRRQFSCQAWQFVQRQGVQWRAESAHCPVDAEEVDDDQGLPVLLTGTNLRDRSPVLMVALRRSTRASAGWTVT